MSDVTSTTDLTAITHHMIEVVSAYVSNHHVPAAQLPDLIASVHGALSGLASGRVTETAEERPEPLTAAQIRKSITPDALISFVDGKPYKTLKRHLAFHGLDPAGYRAKFGLPVDYPMTAPSYSARRSELAKQIGLGANRWQASE